jgi:tRNA A-37 threonylcarbamoyl transferase component Bud32
LKNNLSYFEYLKDNTNYYAPNESNNSKSEFKLKNVPNDYIVKTDKNSPWKYYQSENTELPKQGWKIHISSNLDDSKEILNEVSEILFNLKVAFKHISSESKLYLTYSKQGDRITSGKFITIYPSDDSEFIELLGLIYEKISSYEQGPYILSDKCWKNSNIFYRYGGFVSMINSKGELCIEDTDGNLIPDQRNAFYQVPEFVKKFDEYLDSLNDLMEDQEESNRLEDYEFESAIRFSNSGGIYVARRKADNMKVVIKESRPKVGLDGNNIDSITRQKIEYNALKKLDDVDGIVKVIDYFNSWKHRFLVQKFVEGINLQTWVALKYPFYSANDADTYINDVRKIINSLITIVQQMHEKDIGMGDLQPQNIIINEGLEITLIDFETALPKESEEKPTLHTLGFSNKGCKNHMQRDWYAVKKILQYSLLPIGPIELLDSEIQGHHLQWVEEQFGIETLLYFKEIINKCDHFIPLELQHTITLNENKEIKDLSLIVAELRRGIEFNFISDERLIYGDIRQYEQKDGAMNVLFGGAGAALVFSRAGISNDCVKGWIENKLLPSIYSFEQLGLFTGLSGVASVLYESGYKQESIGIFEHISNSKDESVSDISLRSGLSGIGLSLISLYLEEKNDSYILKAEAIAQTIDNYIDQGKILFVQDVAGVPIGLIDGWSGVSLFYSALFAVTNKRVYYDKSIELIEKDLECTKNDETTNVLHTLDENKRLLPYLSGGSIGIGIAIDYLNHVSGQVHYQSELDLISNLSTVKCTFNGGLFDGAGGFLLLPLLKKRNVSQYNINIDLVTKLLNLYLLKKETHILFPGNLGYRLSHDVYSGSSGIVLALESLIRENSLYWLPIINPNLFYNKTKYLNNQFSQV